MSEYMSVGTFDPVRQWSAYLEATGASPKTIALYRRYVIGYMADTLKALADANEDDLVEYLLPRTPAMRGQIIRGLRSYYSWAVPRGGAKCDPTKNLRIPKPHLREVDALDSTELELLLRAAERLDPRARPALTLAAVTGGRLGSLCALRAEDIKGNRVEWQVSKGDHFYSVPLGKRGREAVRQLMDLRGYVPPLATTRRPTLIGVGEGRFWQWVHEAARLSGVHASPHTLRRTFGTNLWDVPGMDERTWIELMGHKDGSQIRRYAKASAAKVRRAVEDL